MAPRSTQVIWLLLAAGFAGAAASVHGFLDRRSADLELSPPAAAERNPEIALLSIAPGGLRAPIVNYLWIRAQDLKQKGRYYDAMQLASLICRLQPRFPGVWGFHAWNMAWNISAATHTDEERWLWVSNGMRLLRDEGIPMNRTSLDLYQELARIFYSKMGETLDEKHWVYKQRWAAEMQHLLGAPPTGDANEVIAAFRPVADPSLLDRDLARQGVEPIQAGPLGALLGDPAVARYAELLAKLDVKIGQSLLDAYNRYSREPPAAVVRRIIGDPAVQEGREKELSELINSPEHAPARGRMLAFVRAQTLWNVYKMDPQWMLHLMEQYQAPLDWRLVWPHGLYWATYGIHVCGTMQRGNLAALNIDRLVLFCMRSLTWEGRMTYVENPERPDSPAIRLFSDWRYILPAHEEHVRFAKAVLAARAELFEENIFKGGHVNYLVDAIKMLVTLHRYREADNWLNWIRENYNMRGGRWDLPSAVDFLKESYNSGDKPTPNEAVSQITTALQTAFYRLSLGDRKGYDDSLNYARYVYSVFSKDAPPRLRVRPLGEVAAAILAEMLVEPRTMGYNLPLEDRSRLYKEAEHIREKKGDGAEFTLQAVVYDWVARPLRGQCKGQNLDFDAAFPKPADLEAYQTWLKRQFTPVQTGP